MSITLDPKKDAALIKRLAQNTAVASQAGSGATKRTARAKSPRSGKRPRLAAGDGDRQSALTTLAARGWRRTTWDAAGHWMRHVDGRESARYATYREMIDAMLGDDAAACGVAKEVENGKRNYE